MLDLSAGQLKIVEDILKEYVPDCEVRAFGSRIRHDAKKYSDLDLVVIGKTILGIRRLRELEEAFQESDLPMRVDVLDWHSLSASFRAVIEKEYIVLQSQENK